MKLTVCSFPVLCSTASRLGAAHGVSQTLAAFTRTIGPALGGWLYTRGLTDGVPWPLNRAMPYNLCAIVAILGVVQGFYLKKELRKWEVEEGEDEERRGLLADEEEVVFE